ncbi:MAG: respiratory nitrate reductase subunit gamma [Propionibacteriaceae bacterium]|jgi:nitrate reductase gamma subunit|nr:respiratory nitrate reductase subunit gamma [Propionibacteriaceae bacterium]
MMDFFAFVIWPYVALAIFVVGHVWRWRHDQFGWTSRTSQLLERKWLGLASPLFHVGALLVILGHIAGLLVPAELTEALGVSEHLYHSIAVGGGVLAGVLMGVGLVLLIIRRVVFRDRLRLVTTRGDIVLYVLLSVIVFFGFVETVGHNVVGPGYDYRKTVAIWFRSIFIIHPEWTLMASAPFAYRVHATLGFALFAIWPFSRLVHVWSVPIGYLARPYIVYRGTRLATKERGS